MGDNPNVAMLRQAYSQWVACRGEACECWLDILADDATLSSLASGPRRFPSRHRAPADPGSRRISRI